jgi:hypothetical protein
MTKFLPYSTEWTNARKAFLANHGKYKDVTPYDGYLRWLHQFGARESNQVIIIADDADATVFKLKFG